MFHEQNQFHEEKKSMYKSHEKINMQQVHEQKPAWNKIHEKQLANKTQRIKSVSRGEKSMYKFKEEKNPHVTSFVNKIQHETSSKNTKQQATSYTNKIDFKRRKLI